MEVELIAKMDDLQKVVLKILDTIQNEIVNQYHDELMIPTYRVMRGYSFALYNKGTLARDIRLSRSPHEIILYAPHARYVEFGTRPHSRRLGRGSGGRSAFFVNIEQWAHLKLGIAKGKELKRTTWKLVRSIEKKGTPNFEPMHFAINNTLMKFELRKYSK